MDKNMQLTPLKGKLGLKLRLGERKKVKFLLSHNSAANAVISAQCADARSTNATGLTGDSNKQQSSCWN